VVQIERERVMDPLFQGFWGFFDVPRPRVRLRGRPIESIGSGFVLDAEGHILTNYHVLQDADLISSVTLPDGRDIEVEFVGADERSDLAVLKAKDGNLPHATLGDSNGLLIGEWVIAIGNPFGSLMTDSQPTVSVGVVSANHRRVSRTIGEGERYYQDLIQTDAAINPGNSGGPLVNALGEVVGVNTMIFSENGGNIGLGFALPISRVRRVADEIIQYGRRRDPWPGFVAQDIQSIRGDAYRRFGVRVESGCLVTDMLDDCPARKAGLQLADVITAVNGQPVTHPTEIDYAVWASFVGDTFRIEVDRQGERKDIAFDLAELAR
jgi:serine protease Do